MNLHRLPAALALAASAAWLGACSQPAQLVAQHPAQGSAETRVLFLAGPDSHGAGAHEHRAGSELLAAALAQRAPRVASSVYYGGWPEDESLLADIDSLVMYCDGGRNHLINNHLDAFRALLERGVGVVALHYCVEVPKGSDAAQALQDAIGGYFETHWSVNPHWEAQFKSIPQHPVTAGVQPFTLLDEWYFNMRFRTGGVTPLLSAVPPASTTERDDGPHSGNPAVRRMVAEGQPQVLAWAYERDDGGRGFGFTGGHFHANWQQEDFRRTVLNAILWTAGEPTD